MIRCILQPLLLTALAATLTTHACQNVLAPDVRVVIAPPQLNEWFSFAGIGELGGRNIRMGATTGFYLTPSQAFKASGEYLTQILNYDFATKHHNRWVYQYAFGGEYEYLFNYDSFITSVNLGGSYAHASGKPLSNGRRVAGSNDGFGYIGSTIELWDCGFLTGEANYDYVQYNRHFQPRVTVQGWGGSVSFVQKLACDLSLKGTAEFRKPYNFYEGSINWTPRYCQGTMDFGFYGNYTLGKHGLPNATTAGVIIGFAFGQKCQSSDCSKAKECTPYPVCELSYWVTKPAVYIPIVLGIPDERLLAAPL